MCLSPWARLSVTLPLSAWLLVVFICIYCVLFIYPALRLPFVGICHLMHWCPSLSSTEWRVTSFCPSHSGTAASVLGNLALIICAAPHFGCRWIVSCSVGFCVSWLLFFLESVMYGSLGFTEEPSGSAVADTSDRLQVSFSAVCCFHETLLPPRKKKALVLC